MTDKEKIRYFYETVVSQNLIEEVSEYISPDCTVKVGEETFPSGVTGMKEHLVAIRKTYPDYTMRIIRQYQDGDYIISEFIMEGTHQGEWLGMKPTNKKLSFSGVDIDKIVDGKIVEHGGAVNIFETLFQEKIIKPS